MTINGIHLGVAAAGMRRSKRSKIAPRRDDSSIFYNGARKGMLGIRDIGDIVGTLVADSGVDLV
jgi:hypothetical protein